jgi:hypothetical protein
VGGWSFEVSGQHFQASFPIGSDVSDSVREVLNLFARHATFGRVPETSQSYETT